MPQIGDEQLANGPWVAFEAHLLLEYSGILILAMRHVQMHGAPSRARRVDDLAQQAPGAPPQGHERDVQLVESAQVGKGGQLGIKYQFLWKLAGLPSPEL